MNAYQEFQIKKMYEGYPSRDKVIFSGTEKECKDELQALIYRSKRNGADVVSEDECHFTCDEYGPRSETVTFLIEAL